MRVLVTGSAGYIGPVVVRALRAAGHDVVGYDIGWFGIDDGSTWFVRGDIREPLVHPSWPEVVVHLAGLSNDPMGDLDPDLTADINASGTVRMLERYPDARNVIVSSCAVYGAQAVLATEETPPNPQTTYARCKAAVDDTATMLAYREDGYFRSVSLRLGTVFGPAPNHRLDLVVNRMVYDAINNGGVRVTGDAARPLVHVEDVASAVVWAVEGDQRGIYNIIGENVRMRALGKAIARFAQVPVKYESWPGGDARDYMASGEKASRAGWFPTRSVEGSLSELYAFTQKFDGDDLRSHVRLAQLQRLIDREELDPQTLRSIA